MKLIMLLFFSGKGDEKKQTTINKKLDLQNLPSHEPQPSTSTSKAPESDTFLTTPSPSDVERAPIYDSELIETCAPLPKKGNFLSYNQWNENILIPMEERII